MTKHNNISDHGILIFTSSFLISGCGDKPQALEKSVISYSTVGSFASFSTNACLTDSSCVFAWKVDGESAGSERTVSQKLKRPGSHSVSLTVTKGDRTVADLSESFMTDAAPESTEKALWNSPAPALKGSAAESGDSSSNDEPQAAGAGASAEPAAAPSDSAGAESAAETTAEPAPEPKAEEPAPAAETPAPAPEEKKEEPAAETKAPEPKKEESGSSSSGDGSSFTVDFGDMFGSDAPAAEEPAKPAEQAQEKAEEKAEPKAEEPKAEEEPKTEEQPKAEEQPKSEEQSAESPKAEEQKTDVAEPAPAADASAAPALPRMSLQRRSLPRAMLLLPQRASLRTPQPHRIPQLPALQRARIQQWRLLPLSRRMRPRTRPQMLPGRMTLPRG